MFDIGVSSVNPRLNKSQWLHAFNESVFERQFEIKPQTFFHRLIYLENDVLSQVVAKLFHAHRNFILVRLHNLLDVRDAFVARTRKVDRPRTLDTRFTYHPHCKDESESRVLPPKTRHVPNVQPLAGKRHAWIADNQCRVIHFEHLCEIWIARRPLRLMFEKFSEDYFYQCCRSA